MTRIMLLFAIAATLAQRSPAEPVSPDHIHALPVSAPTLTARYGADPLQMGELRLPPGKGPFPVAIVFHGGCWMKGYDTLAGAAPLADALTRRGIATWNVEYRQTGDAGGGWPGSFQDIGAAIDYLRVLARRQPLDLGRVVLVGHSAGAHAVLWAASRAKLPTASPIRGRRPLAVAAVVAIDGPGTITPWVGLDAKVCGRPVIVPLMGATPEADPQRYHDVSAQDHLPLGVPQYLVEGGLAFAVEPYAAAARAAGDHVEVLAPPGADHFDIISPDQPNGRAVVDFIVTRAFGMPATSR